MANDPCQKLVLIVEDDPDVREALGEVLEDADYHTLLASNGVEALKQLRNGDHKPCVILLDMMMPVMDGWQFRAEQEQDPAIADIPVVVITAHATVKETAEQLRADAHLRKPVPLETLLHTVGRFCASG